VCVCGYGYSPNIILPERQYLGRIHSFTVCNASCNFTITVHYYIINRRRLVLFITLSFWAYYFISFQRIRTAPKRILTPHSRTSWLTAPLSLTTVPFFLFFFILTKKKKDFTAPLAWRFNNNYFKTSWRPSWPVASPRTSICLSHGRVTWFSDCHMSPKILQKKTGWKDRKSQQFCISSYKFSHHQ
jgi:hypothetical protein